jgi:hypothetical protein
MHNAPNPADNADLIDRDAHFDVELAMICLKKGVYGWRMCSHPQNRNLKEKVPIQNNLFKQILSSLIFSCRIADMETWMYPCCLSQGNG